MARYSKPLHVDEDALHELEEYARNNPDATKRERASMVLECARGKQVMDVATQLSKRPNSVMFWKERYAAEGIAGFENRPRGKSKDAYGSDFGERLFSSIEEAPPEGSPHWTAKLLSVRLGVPDYAVRRFLKREHINLATWKPTSVPTEQGPSMDPISHDKGGPSSEAGIADGEEKAAMKATDNGVQMGTHELVGTDGESTHLDIRITMDAMDSAGNVLRNMSISLPRILADIDHFDVCSLEGFRRDYGQFEQGSINGFVQLLQSFSADFSDEVSKKKLTEHPEMPWEYHPVLGEFVKFNVTALGDMTKQLSSNEAILTEAQEKIHLTCVTNAGGTYRKTAELINMMQHRTECSLIKSRQLQDFANRTGDSMASSLLSEADAILQEFGFDPQTLKPLEDGSFASHIRLPDAETSCVTHEMVAEAIAKFNEGKDDFAQIKDLSLLSRMEANPDDAIYICDDDVGVERQNEKRAVRGRQAEKSTKRVENTVIFIMRNKKIYRITSTNRFIAVKLTLAFALKNGLAEGAPLVFFSDGANNIRTSVENYFSFYPYTLNLDWHHCEKRIMQVGSMAFNGSKESKRELYYEITRRLWPGNIDDALTYIGTLESDRVKNQKQFNELKDYINRKRPFLYCYALRKEMGYLNASSPVEKTNDLIVAQRQKHNGMSWSYPGSGNLAIISAVRQNGELDTWVSHRRLHLCFPSG